MTTKIYLQDILPLEKLSSEGTVIIVRHYHENLDYMVKNMIVEEYQSFQHQPAFKKCEYIISFLGSEKNTAIFYGVFQIKNVLSGKYLPKYSIKLEPHCRPLNLDQDFMLVLERKNEYDIYQNRLIIDWVVPRGWYKTFGSTQSKPVIRILPYNFVSEFPGVMNIKLSFCELEKIIQNMESHEEWYNSLTRLQAIYLILDKSSGKLYVGSTFGENGLWQRWSNYVSSGGTGGNKKLMELQSENKNFQNDLQFSVLEILTKTAEKKYCIQKESLWKEKLGSRARAFGLNDN